MRKKLNSLEQFKDDDLTLFRVKEMIIKYYLRD
jgi:hypothetical protein